MFNPKPAETSMILMVVNTTNTLGVLFDYLRGFGFKVMVASDGESALSTVEHIKPDIILLDVALPGIDGFETCRRLKANEATKHIPVIFITAQANTVDKVRGFALGAVDYITRPIQSEEVVARLKTHLTLRQLQLALAEQNTRLQAEIAEREELIEELDAFAHTVAHDLKNPLGVTINYAAFLQKFLDKLSPEDLKNRLDVIVRNGQKMNNIINELLLLASVRTEEIDLQPLEMAEIVAEVQARLAYMIEEYQAEIIVPTESAWPTAWGYGPWIEEVWTNYVSNAMKYGGQPPRVELGGTVMDDGWVKFWVRDNGRGLTPVEQRELFIPFNRLSQAHLEGHGLGLSIVQRIVEKLGGTVAVESKGTPGEGSLFSFTLPPSNLKDESKTRSQTDAKGGNELNYEE
ncbi:MAG: hybrid sensor histidine kinase/response regulator [Anaerolineales bacterium]|nr:hybrid sensor histidine kinase/response regulator [Anaerolineales bacterium]